MGDLEKVRAARAASATKFPIRVGFPLGDGNWDKRHVTLLLHSNGDVAWDAEGYKKREAEELDRLFGPIPTAPEDTNG